jgi:hypothetical protein
MKVFIRLLAFGLLTACVVGCSHGGVKKVTIAGTVTYKGEPLRSGILRVVSTGGEFATAPIRADGTFTLTDVVPGEVQVGIMSEPQSWSSSDGKGRSAPRPVPIPAKYQGPQTSGLKYTITGTSRPLAIELR